MAPSGAKAIAPRKRNRKRKRRAASASSSSSSSSSSGSDDEILQKPLPVKRAPSTTILPEESSSESSSEESSSDSESDSEHKTTTLPSVASKQPVAPRSVLTRRSSPSPSPPPSALPSFLTPAEGENVLEKEQLMKDRFRKFWMAAVADGFKSDLEEIRKEPNLGTSRLSLLIDSLASGADIFTTSSRPDKSTINEIEVILE